MILKYISSKVIRVKDSDTEIYWLGNYCSNLVIMKIQFKVFGLFWIVGKTYMYEYFKNKEL